MLMRACLLGLGLLVMTAAQSSEGELDTTHLTKLGMKVESVRATEVSGLYEIITSEGLFYVSADGTLLVSGRMFDITGDEVVNKTEQNMAAMRRSDLAKIEDSMIVYKAPQQKHEVTIFTDTTCGYCQQFHARIDDYLDLGISVRYVAFPRNGMQGTGGQQLQAVWCAADKKAALTAAKAEEDIALTTCANPVEEHFLLGRKFGVRGTPAIITENGELIAGAMPPRALLEEIEKRAASQPQ